MVSRLGWPVIYTNSEERRIAALIVRERDDDTCDLQVFPPFAPSTMIESIPFGDGAGRFALVDAVQAPPPAPVPSDNQPADPPPA